MAAKGGHIDFMFLGPPLPGRWIPFCRTGGGYGTLATHHVGSATGYLHHIQLPPETSLASHTSNFLASQSHVFFFISGDAASKQSWLILNILVSSKIISRTIIFIYLSGSQLRHLNNSFRVRQFECIWIKKKNFWTFLFFNFSGNFVKVIVVPILSLI